MRRLTLALPLFGIAALTAIGTRQHLEAQAPAQLLRPYYTYMPWTGGTADDATFQALTATTIPMFRYSIPATKDGRTYNGVMVGGSPFTRPLAVTRISTVIVPLKIFIGPDSFDPTAPNTCDSNESTVARFFASPLVQDVPNLTFNGVNVGSTQYVNGFRRAEFWQAINGSTSYQNRLSPATLAAGVGVSAGTHGITFASNCNLLGVVSINWLDNYLKTALLPYLKAHGVIDSSKFVFFLLKNVVMSFNDPPDIFSCCVIGYHEATGSPVQTFGIANWDTTGDFGAGISDATAPSHEIAEWMDDPLGNNPTPNWGNIGQVSGCQNNLEVGDPLTGTNMPAIVLNGYTFHVQELAFFSWYFNSYGMASLGAGGDFSGNDTFERPSNFCPPGGSN